MELRRRLRTRNWLSSAKWLDRGFAGEMDYIHRSAERRADVRDLMPSARTVICLGTLDNTELTVFHRGQATMVGRRSPATHGATTIMP